MNIWHSRCTVNELTLKTTHNNKTNCQPRQVIVTSAVFIRNWTFHSPRQTRQSRVPLKRVGVVGLSFEVSPAITGSVITEEDDLSAAVHWWRVVAVTTFVHQLQYSVIVWQQLVGNSSIVDISRAKHHAHTQSVYTVRHASTCNNSHIHQETSILTEWSVSLQN